MITDGRTHIGLAFAPESLTTATLQSDAQVKVAIDCILGHSSLGEAAYF